MNGQMSKKDRGQRWNETDQMLEAKGQESERKPQEENSEKTIK